MPKSVYAVGFKSESGCWNHVASNLKWKNGLKAVCEASMDMKGGHPFTIELRVCGDKGALDYSFGWLCKLNSQGTRRVYRL